MIDAEAVLRLRRRGGWGANEARSALEASGGNVERAHGSLAGREAVQLEAATASGLRELTGLGFDATDARRALRLSRLDAQEARTGLERDRADFERELTAAVQAMAANG
jgi:translation elongation factor EF-Ts